MGERGRFWPSAEAVILALSEAAILGLGGREIWVLARREVWAVGGAVILVIGWCGDIAASQNCARTVMLAAATRLDDLKSELFHCHLQGR
jgi:hypothetical protein